MDIRTIYLPSGGLAETHGNWVRLTTPSGGALAALRQIRSEIQAATVAEACASSAASFASAALRSASALLTSSTAWRASAPAV